MRSLRTSPGYAGACLLLMVALFVALVSNVCRADSRDNGRTTDATPSVRLDPLFDAIATVESTNNTGAIGDNGNALGIYQIHCSYWTDSKIVGNWRDCLHDERYSRRVVLAYWKRYCPTALRTGDYKTLAMIHHGGPNGSTDTHYWTKIQNAMADNPQSGRVASTD